MKTCTLDSTSLCREEVFTRFFKEQVKNLRHFLFYRFGDQDQSKDIAQEAFVLLWQHCEHVPYDSARSYVYTVAYNKALKVKAHEKVILTYEQGNLHKTENNESPQFLLEEKQFKEKLVKAISNLNETQRVAFLMNRIDKLKYAEIASILGISIKAVEKRIHLAMVALKKDLTNFK